MIAGQPSPEIVAGIFYGAAVTDMMAILVAERTGGATRVTWGNQGAVKLLGYGLEDLGNLPFDTLLPTLRGGELKLLLRRERGTQMNLPIRTASGATVECVLISTPMPSGRMWTLRVVAGTNEQERALRATDDAHERRFSTLTERSPIPMLLSEQGLRLARVHATLCRRGGRTSPTPSPPSRPAGPRSCPAPAGPAPPPPPPSTPASSRPPMPSRAGTA